MERITDNTSVEVSDVEILEQRRGDRGYVKVWRLPEHEYPHDESYDVTVRSAMDSDGVREHLERVDLYHDREKAVEAAVEKAKEYDLPLIDQMEMAPE